MKLSARSNICDPGSVERFLSGQLGVADERDFTLHLNTCEDCRHLLEEQAAKREDWMEAAKLLQPSGYDSPHDDEFGSATANQSRRQPHLIQAVLDALAPTDDPQMLGRLGAYEVSGVVGAGGMGVVLKAIDKSLDRTVAIKVLAPHLAASGAARKRFAREAKAAAAVLHPNVIAIHGVSNDEALPYLVMPYLRGPSLQKRLDEEGPLPLNEILRIGSQVAAGLAAAHAQGLVHRDIKPANILLEEGVERVAITDFGLARAVDDGTITHSGAIAGTPQYMSPEQARGESIDSRSDLFSLGSVLYAMCTGRPPFRAETAYGVMRRITDDEPTSMREINPDTPEWLCSIVASLMSKRSSDRFGSAAEVQELLAVCLAHVQHPAAVPRPRGLNLLPQQRGSWAGERKSLFRKGAIVMIAVLCFLGMGLWLSADAPDISGRWTGEGWGEVVLKQNDDGAYEGTYTDTFGKEAGGLELKWSRVERRFKGTWREGKDRFGRIAVRKVGDEIRGAWTTNEKSSINPGTPELADLLWLRPAATTTKLEGEWRLDSITGGKVIGYEKGLIVRVRGDRWTIVRESGESPHRLVLGADGNQQAIDLFVDQGDVPPIIYRGLYHLHGDTLTIAWGAPPSARPTGFEGIDAGVHTWNRIKAEGTVSKATSQTSDLKTLQKFDGNHTAATHFSDIGIVSAVYPERNQIEVSLIEAGLTKVGDVLEITRSTEGVPGQFTRYGLVRVVEVQKAKDTVIAVLTHSTRHRVENRYEWMAPALGDHVTRKKINAASANSTPADVSSKPETPIVGAPVGDTELPPAPAGVLTAAQVVEQGNALYHSRKKVAVRFRVESVTQVTLRDEQRKESKRWNLSSKAKSDRVDSTAFSVVLSPEAEAALDRGGISNIARHYVGRLIEVEGVVYGVGLDLVFQPTTWTYHMDVDFLDQIREVTPGQPTATATTPKRGAAEEGFSETRDVVLSMNSSKFMLDLDTGKTMDPPARTGRPEQLQMDLQTDQVQPYHFPTKLIGLGLVGREVKASDWNASAADIRKALAGDAVGPLKEMDLGPEKNPTYFFRTREGGYGILQLLEIVQEPKGIRIRYKTVAADRNTSAEQKTSSVPPGVGEPRAIAPTPSERNLTTGPRSDPRPDSPPKETKGMPQRRINLQIDDRVEVIACSADGKLIAFANGSPTLVLRTDGTSRVTDNWKPLVEIMEGEKDFGERGTISLDLTSDEEDAVLAATPRVSHFEVTALEFSPDATLLAVGTSIGQVKLFNAKTGKLVQSLDDEQARLADKETPENWKSLRRAMGSVASLAFSSDSALLAVCGTSFGDYSDTFDGVDGLGRLATGPGRLKVWNVGTGALKHDLAGHSHAFDVAFSPDGTLLASAGSWGGNEGNGTGVITWNTENGQKVSVIAKEANAGVHAVAFSPTRKLIAIAAVRYDKENDAYSTAISVAFPMSGITEWEQTIPGWAKPKAFTPDGTSVAVLCGNQSIRFIEVETGRVKHEIKATDSAQRGRWTDFAIPPKAQVLLIGRSVGERRGGIEFWSLDGDGMVQK